METGTEIKYPPLKKYRVTLSRTGGLTTPAGKKVYELQDYSPEAAILRAKRNAVSGEWSDLWMIDIRAECAEVSE